MSSRLRRLLVDYNPFFLLSALCMLAGSLALTNSLSWSPVRLERILVLTVTINAYELLLVALGLFLIVRRGVRRDGSILLIVEAFFLVDVAFLNAELFAIDRSVGLVANTALLTLAFLKLYAIVRVLRIDVHGPLAAILACEIAALYALPGVLKFNATASGGTLPPMTMLVVWWMLATLGAGGFAAMRNRHAIPRGDTLLPWFAPLLTILASVSLAAHAATGQWVYDLHYWGADLAPMLALAAFVLCSSAGTRGAGVLIALAALFASTSYDSRLTFAMPGTRVSPVHLTATAVYLLLAWTLLRNAFGRALAVGASAAIVALFGPSLMTVRAFLETVWEAIVALADAARPKTQSQWGLVAIAMSFVFLVVGTLVSLRRSGNDAGRSVGPA